MEIRTGPYEVYADGTLINFEQERITFDFGSSLKISMSFKDDNTQDDPVIKFVPINNNELELELVNFNNPLGTGTSKPIHVGTLQSRELYLNFKVYANNDKTNNVVHYTWYLGKAAKGNAGM